MIAGMSGSLLSHDAIEQSIASGQEPELAPARWLPLQGQLRMWHAELRHRLGPTAGPRTVFDLVAGPLASTLGFVVLPVSAGSGAVKTETIDAELRWEGRPLAVIVASAWAQPARSMLLGKHRTTEAMADVMLSVAAEINSALQIIVGHCDLLERGYPDPMLQRDLATVVRQAQRISELLEKMRTAANDRLKEVATSIEGVGIPSSPEAYAHDAA